MQFDIRLMPGANEGEGPLELIEKADRQLGELLATLHKLADMEILVERTENRPSK